MRRLLSLAGFLLSCLIIFSALIELKEGVKKYNNTYETTGYNRSPFIDKCNTRKGVPLGSPYCGTVTDSIIHEFGAVAPNIKGGWARSYITADAVPSIDVLLGKAVIPNECLCVFVRRGGGHVGIYCGQVVIRGVLYIRIFEPNTTPDGKLGSQHNGTWTGYKLRELKKICSPYAPFRITHFVPITFRG